MEVEIFNGIERPFTIGSTPPTDEFAALELEMILQDLKARLTICRKLGLTTQEKILMELYAVNALKAIVPYPCLSTQEEQSVSRRFPTRYLYKLSSADQQVGYESLANYQYDLIPPLALAEWGACVDVTLFSAYEIWTAERLQKPDPVLIGRRDEHPRVYLIARWGDALVPFEEIVRERRRL